jgi:hypothetical protein
MPLTTVSPGMLDTTAQYYGFKSRIINGNMAIDQRNAGASFTSNGLFYCVDRWLLQAVGATNTAQQVTGSTGNNKAVLITGNTSNTLTGFSQRIEAANIYDCASQTVTVSFTLFGSASGSVSVRFIYPTATDNYTSTTEPVAGTTVNFTTTATQYSVTRTLDSNANKGVWVYFDFGALGSGVTRTIEFVQLEKGSTATSFDYRPYGTELALCQRYFQKYTGALQGSWGNTTVTYQAYLLPVVMRAAPTWNYSNIGYSAAASLGTNSATASLLRAALTITAGGGYGYATFDMETSGAEL